MKLTRRTFSGVLLSAPAVAQERPQPAAPVRIDLPPAQSSSGGEPFELPGPPSPRTRWNVPGPPRKYFYEWLPALFERTVELDQWTGAKPALRWIFTGPDGGFTVEAASGRISLSVRYYDSPGLVKPPARPGRQPETIIEDAGIEYSGDLKTVTVLADYRLTVRVLLNGKEALVSNLAPDVNRHQFAIAATDGAVRARLLTPAPQPAAISVDESARFQQMLGFGGTTTPPAFAELSPDGRREWWRIVAEYNLLLHREYPTGAMLNREITNWDNPADASPHYYGDNFPNCETTDFEYLRRIRRLGGQVIFEFWELPPWARRRDAAGKLTEAPDLPEYVRAMVGYCRACQQKTGHPPEIVGIQNEVEQRPEDWRAMALALRRGLDAAGFQAVKIHMHNPPFASAGASAGQAFREDPAVWNAIDYGASNLYDYQGFFHNPDGFDKPLTALRDATAGKPFFAVELCVNNNNFQTRSYRVAFAMGQLYHKTLTLLDACGVMYCWTLLNTTQPSYGWTRTLCAPDAEHGLKPSATSHQLRVFGAFTRRVRAGMRRVGAQSSNPNLLATAFLGSAGERTLILLNRTPYAQKLDVTWPGAKFRYLETADCLHQNSVEPYIQSALTIAPGAIVTLTNVELGKVPDSFWHA